MTCSFGFECNSRILLAIVGGSLEDADLLEILDSLQRQAKALAASAVILDYSDVTSVNLSPQGIWAASQVPSPSLESTPRYLVAPQEHLYGFARMFQMMGGRSHDTFHVVRSADEALLALGIPNPLFEPVDANPSHPGPQTAVLACC